MRAQYNRRPSSTAVVVLILVMFLSPAFAGKESLQELGEKPVKVDFRDVVKKNGSESITKDTPTIKIAVAAMISPEDTYKYYVNLLNLIGKHMGRQVTFIQKKSYAEVNEMLKRKEVDLAFVCSGPYVSGKKDFGMEIIAVPVCHGEKVYYSYFIINKKSRIKSFNDLRGKTFAFTDPLSNTGFLVPTYYLAKRNETPQTFFKTTFFTHSHDNSIEAVANGFADGAAVDSLIFEFMQAANPEVTQKTIIIEKSPPYGIPPIVVHPSMQPETKENLKKIFFSIHEDPEGKAALNKLQIDRFTAGDDADYDTVRELQQFLKSTQH